MNPFKESASVYLGSNYYAFKSDGDLYIKPTVKPGECENVYIIRKEHVGLLIQFLLNNFNGEAWK